MTRILMVLAIALLVYSCVPPTQPTPAVVARMLASEKRQSMVACTVNLNWTEEQLVHPLTRRHVHGGDDIVEDRLAAELQALAATVETRQANTPG